MQCMSCAIQTTNKQIEYYFINLIISVAISIAIIANKCYCNVDVAIMADVIITISIKFDCCVFILKNDVIAYFLML